MPATLSPGGGETGATAPRRVGAGRAAALAWLLGCAPVGATSHTPVPSPRPRAAGPRTSAVVSVTVPPGDGPLTVRWCFDGPMPKLAFRTQRGRAATLDLSTPNGRSLRRDRGIAPPDGPPPRCLVHRLRRATIVRERHGDGADLLLAVHDLLLRPTPPPGRTEVRFAVPKGAVVTTPWPEGPAPGTFRPAPSVHRFPGYVAVGPPPALVQAPGGTIRLRPLGALRADTPALRAMVEDAAATVQAVYGAMPRATMAVFVRPARWARGVGFGQMLRGGGAAVVLRVGPGAPADALPGNWTVTHEFLHATMPFADDPWLGEGIASYWTEIGRTRAGHRSEREGWRALEAAFERGRRRRRIRTLAAASDAMHRTFSYQHVYWGGAALCLLLDVTIRRRTGGREGLEDAARAIQGWLDAPRAIPAERIVRAWERRYGDGLWALVERELARGFPELADTFAFLGVQHTADGVVLDDAAPGAAIRRAIMAPRRPRPNGGDDDPATRDDPARPRGRPAPAQPPGRTPDPPGG